MMQKPPTTTMHSLDHQNKSNLMSYFANRHASFEDKKWKKYFDIPKMRTQSWQNIKIISWSKIILSVYFTKFAL